MLNLRLNYTVFNIIILFQLFISNKRKPIMITLTPLLKSQLQKIPMSNDQDSKD